MSRTKRFYNKPNQYLYIHPYKEMCMGNCRSCRKYKNSKRGYAWMTKADWKNFIFSKGL